MSRAVRRPFVERKRQERGTRRSEEIVAAAAALFAERGFDGTSLNAIAKAAGVTIASIYQYFPNRDAIVDAVAELYLAALRADKAESMQRVAEYSLQDLIRVGVHTLFDFQAKYGGVKTFLDADPRRAASIRTIHEEVADFVPIVGRFYPDRSYDELARVVFAVSSIIRGSATALAALDAPAGRSHFIDDIIVAVEAFIHARLGTPIELGATAASMGSG
jgi:AcrR family transcriptional regulator